MPKRSRSTRLTSKDSGVTATGNVSQNAGRDTAGRDIIHNTIYNFRDLLTGSSDEARYQAGRSTEQRHKLATKLEIEYSERLEQALGPFSDHPKAKLRTVPEAIPDSLGFLQTRRQTAPTLVSSNVSLLQLYRQKQSLLVLGEPGAGKTTFLLQLAVQVLSNNESGLEQMPVIAPVSTWERRKKSMRKGSPSDQLLSWLINLFEEIYKIPDSLGLNWLKNGYLILLLDGLDEIKDSSERSSFLVAMNEYVVRYSSNVVLSCRVAEYKAIGLQAKLEQAVIIEPLSPTDVLKFIERQGVAYRDLAESLSHDEELLKLCTSPLFLNMVMFTYPLQLPGQVIPPPDSQISMRAWLLRGYVNEQFKQALLREDPGLLPFIGLNRQRSIKWLAWLSENLTEHSQADFLLERMRPNWLPKIGAFIVRLCQTLLLLSIALLGFHSGTVGLVFIVILVPVSIFLGFNYFPTSMDVRWSVKTAFVKWRSQLVIAVYGSLLGLIVIVTSVSPLITRFQIWPFGFEANRYVTGIVIGAMIGEITGIILTGFTATITESKRRPYDSIISSLWTGSWVFILACAAIIFFTFAIYKVAGSEQYLFSPTRYYVLNLSSPAWNQVIHLSVFYSLAFAYFCGWGFVLLHAILRLCIWAWGVGPSRYVRWLNAMVGLRLIYRSGAGFVFMHRILQEVFSSQEPPGLCEYFSLMMTNGRSSQMDGSRGDKAHGLLRGTDRQEIARPRRPSPARPAECQIG
jgi:hypothetical protein